jgi:Tfp pilus assembly protein PilN
MNIQAINLKSAKRRRQAAAKSTVTGRIYIVAGFLLIFGLLALCLNYRTWLNKNIANIDKQIVSYDRKIHELDREIQDLRLRKESLSSWAHVQNQIAALKIDLRRPSPAQLQKLVLSPDNKSKTGRDDKKVAMVSEK